MLQSYHLLIRFWAVILLLSGTGAAALQVLGPPPSAGRGGESSRAEAPPAPQPPERLDVPVLAALPPAQKNIAPAVEPTPAPTAVAAVPIALPRPEAADEPETADLPLPPPVPPGPRKASPVRRAGEGAGVRYGYADRRYPTRDIWGNPLTPAYQNWADRAPPAPRAADSYNGYIGVYTVGPDGTRMFRAGP